MTESPFMRMMEAARFLDISRSGMYRLATDGTVKSVVIGDGTRRIVRASLYAYAERLIREASGDAPLDPSTTIVSSEFFDMLMADEDGEDKPRLRKLMSEPSVLDS